MTSIPSSNINQNQNSSHILQKPSTETSQPNQQFTPASETPDQNVEIKAAKIGAKATCRAAIIGAIGTGIAGLALYGITSHYQSNDGRQKALNDYVNGVKELIASTEINREQPKKIATLQYAKALLVMRELDEDGDRKGQALRFLHENCLVVIQKEGVPFFGCKAAQTTTAQETFDLGGANLHEINLADAWIPNINLSKVYMRGANLQNADLSVAILTEADITPHQKSGFWGTVLSLGGLLKQNANLQNTKLIYADLSNADLSNADLSNADLRFADLRFANLTNANLTETNLTGACYVAGKEDRFFPPGFDPTARGMVALSKETSDPNQHTFERCPTKR